MADIQVNKLEENHYEDENEKLGQDDDNENNKICLIAVKRRVGDRYVCEITFVFQSTYLFCLFEVASKATIISNERL